MFNLVYKLYNASAILIEWPQQIDTAILHDILAFKAKLQAGNFINIKYLNHAYASLLIHYNALNFDVAIEQQKLKDVYKSVTSKNVSEQTLWKIPVCYDLDFGIDLKALALEKQMDVGAIIERHSKPIYTVFFIGFLPGFLYLGGLDKRLFTPRKATPRLAINEGAVAIGGEQTGIYPTKSPGGWHIIGNSPIRFFDVLKEVPCFVKAGDCIQFYPVNLKTHQDIKTLVDAGVYQIESEVLHG